MALKKQPRKLEAEALWIYALKLLGGRALSAGEVREKLRAKAEDPASVDGVMARLNDHRFLDDARFAEGYAASRRDNEGFGKFRVLQDLRKRRVPGAVAEQKAAEVFADVDETAQARQYLERKYRTKDLPVFLAEEKHAAQAYRRLRTAGFGTSTAIRVLKSFTPRAEELESLDLEEPADQ